MSTPALILAIDIHPQHTITGRSVLEQLRLDASATDQPASNTVAGHHDAEPSRIQMKCRGICPTTQWVMDDHQRALKPLEAVAGFDEHIRQISGQTLPNSANLGNVSTYNTDH